MDIRHAGRLGALVGGAVLLLATNITAAVATSTYKGTLSYGVITVHTTCSGSPAVPTSVTASVPYDATHWNTSAPMSVVSTYEPDDPNGFGFARVTAPASIIQAGHVGTISATLKVPAEAPSLPNDGFFLGDYGQMAGPRLYYTPSCASPDSRAPLPPTVVSISHPCLGTTTATVTNVSAVDWTVGGVGFGPYIPAGSTATLVEGSALPGDEVPLQGAEHFVIGFVSASGLSSVPFLYSAACVPGHPVTTFKAIHRYTHDVLTATAKTGLVEEPSAFPAGYWTTHLPLVGAPVTFYRISAGKRILVGTGHTGPHGISVLSVPHRAGASYLAVIGATNYSLRTATVTRSVR